MKKLLSIIIALTLVFTTAITSFAVEKVSTVEKDDAQGIEKKIVCEADLNDNFEDNSVIVILNNKYSLELNNFDSNSFSKVGAKSVKDITSYSVKAIKSKLNEKERAVKDITAKFKSNKAYSDVTTLAEAKMIEDVHNEIKKENSDFHQMLVLNLNKKSKQNVLDVIHELEKSEYVVAAEPNYVVSLASLNETPVGSSNDSTRNETDNNIQLQEAWNITTGSKNVNVGILDSGIKGDHPDLQQNLDFELGKSFVDDSPYIDEFGHGTHVAGIIGSSANNGIGIDGTCWNVNMISLQIFNSKGTGSVADIAEAIDYASANDIEILNFSGSTSGDKDYQKNYLALQNAINNYDGLFVCSAGNQAINIDSPGVYEGNKKFSTYTIYPATYENDNILPVAATNVDDILWFNGTYDGSSYGEKSVDLAAPGVSIYSAYISKNGYGDYVRMSGTSMAAPYVAGVAALIKSKYPTISTEGIKKAILDGTDKIDSLTGKVKTGGRLNAYKAITAVENCKYTVEYDKNGGTGENMDTTVVTYGIATKLNPNKYAPPTVSTLFNGWYAYRQADNSWYYASGNENGWYTEGSQPAGYEKYLFRDKVTVTHLSSQNNDIIKMYAQWIDKSDILLGDVDLNGIINANDATMINKYLSGICSLDDVQKYAADVNQDGKINVSDATAIQKIIAGII